MVNLSLIPSWFLSYGVIFEIAFAIITLAVSIYSFRIYKLSGQNQSKIFGIAFLFFSISYFIESLLNISIISELNEKFLSVIDLRSLIAMDALSILVHMVLFTFGLVTLIYMILGGKNKMIYFISLIVSMLFILLSVNKIYFFYVLSSLLLVYIFTHYIDNYIQSKDKRSLIVTIAFAFLLLGQIHFIFLVNHSVYYVVGNFLELIAYILILVNLLKVIKK
jgi:hypothetical protein